MEIKELIELIRPICGSEPQLVLNSAPPTISIDPKDLKAALLQLYTNQQTYFDMLSCITGIDTGSTIEIVYVLYSIPYNTRVMVKIALSREHPEVDSVADIWRSANWLEREVFDMFGVDFKNHPDLRRILMPADWEGFPLRKDYQPQERYREIVVKYDR